MAFKLQQKETFTTLVTVNIPNDKGGFDKSTFVAKWKRPTLDQIETLRKLDNVELARTQMVGWEMRDADSNEEVPFTRDNLEAAMQILPTPLATTLAFWDHVNGARAKN